MALWDSVKRLFGGPSGDGDDGIYLYVRCDRCGDQVRVRINPRSELLQEFDPASDRVSGYAVRKVAIDQRCFRPIEIQLRFDAGRRELERHIEGGTFISAEEYTPKP
jgi:hypothetical protein